MIINLIPKIPIFPTIPTPVTIYIAVNGGRPTWKSTIESDDSLVITIVRTQVPSPDDPKKNIPWLVTQTTHNEGSGAFSDVTYVLRIATSGGVTPPVSDCKCKNYFF